MPPVVNRAKCNGCLLCEMYCPLDVIYMVDDVAEIRYPDECWHCGACRLECRKDAITIEFTPSMLGI